MIIYSRLAQTMSEIGVLVRFMPPLPSMIIRVMFATFRVLPLTRAFAEMISLMPSPFSDTSPKEEVDRSI